jgi:DNA-directed RNA polymerase omega subunit
MKRTEIPPHEELMHRIKNKYEFILAVSKRARMLVEGAPSAEGIEGVKPTTKALGELLGAKITYQVHEDPDK